MSKPNFAKLRLDFPMLKQKMHGKPLVYLDTAATAQKPQSVIDTLTQFYQSHYGTVHRAIYELSVLATHEYEGTRHKIKAFLNAAKPEEIIFTRGTTDAINMVAYSFGKAFISPEDEVLISEMEHHSNIVPWQMMCERQNANLKVIPINNRAEIIMEEYAKLLTERTKIVAIPHIANSTGTLLPIKEMISMAHKKGAKVLIDGAQSAPHMPVDVQGLDADFYAFSGHKLYGPTGIGVLYGKEKLLEQMPPYQGGGDMIASVTFPKTTYNVLPLKFEAGTPLIAEVIGLGAAIDYVQKIGLQSIYEWEKDLLDYSTSQLNKIKKLRIIGTAKEKGSILSFVVENAHALDVGTLLDLRGIAIRTGHVCAQPTMLRFGVPSICRASFGLYNTKEEVDYFVFSLKEVISTLT